MNLSICKVSRSVWSCGQSCLKCFCCGRSGQHKREVQAWEECSVSKQYVCRSNKWLGEGLKLICQELNSSVQIKIFWLIQCIKEESNYYLLMIFWHSPYGWCCWVWRVFHHWTSCSRQSLKLVLYSQCPRSCDCSQHSCLRCLFYCFCWKLFWILSTVCPEMNCCWSWKFLKKKDVSLYFHQRIQGNTEV